MQRSCSETRIGEKQIRYHTKLTDDPSQSGSWEARNRLLNLFQTILYSPDLINCGFSFPQKIVMTHNGNAWVIEAEAVADTEASL